MTNIRNNCFATKVCLNTRSTGDLHELFLWVVSACGSLTKCNTRKYQASIVLFCAWDSHSPSPHLVFLLSGPGKKKKEMPNKSLISRCGLPWQTDCRVVWLWHEAVWLCNLSTDSSAILERNSVDKNYENCSYIFNTGVLSLIRIETLYPSPKRAKERKKNTRRQNIAPIHLNKQIKKKYR